MHLHPCLASVARVPTLFSGLSRPAAWLRRMVWWCMVALLPAAVWSHDMPKSSVMLHFRQTHVLMDLRLPTDRLELALGINAAQPATQPATQPAAQPAAQAAAQAAQAARPVWQNVLPAYLLARVHAYSESGQAWTVALQALHPPSTEAPDEVRAQLVLTPPANGSPTRFRLEYEVILREIATHIAVLAVQSDWERGVSANQPELLANLRFGEHTLSIQRSAGSAWAGPLGMFRLGMEHIAAGVDHVLFLFTLLLIAPASIRGGQPQSPKAARAVLRQIFFAVSAFTLGHSLALVLGVIGWLRLPSQPVEIAIAVSVLLSALHAVRPLYPGREAVVTGGFGLIHGLAFAASLAAFELDPAHLAAALLGFNLGIEAVQLLIMLATLPALLLLRTTPWFVPFRASVAALAGAAALGWVVERSLDWHSPLSPWLEQLPPHAPEAAVALLLLAVAAKIRTTYKNRRPAACISNARC